MSDEGPTTPLEMLNALAVQEVEISSDLRHIEIYTNEGLLTLLWHGPREATEVVVMGGGAMGGMLGPAEGLYHALGVRLGEQGVGSVRVGYRRPNDLPACVHDMGAAADLCARHGATSFVTVGHSFGGAVAIQSGVALMDHVVGVVTLATQSAGCEVAEDFTKPLLLLHGDSDQILPHMASEMVRMMCGGELVILAGADHLLTSAREQIETKLMEWIPARFAGEPAGSDVTAE